MIIDVEKLYEFLDSTSFLYRGDILELLDNIVEKWCGLTLEALWQAFQKSSKPLPEPHGRLIDADDLDITTITTDDYSGNKVLDIVLKEDVDNAPTIIPAIEEKSCATCGQPRNYTGDCILFMERKCVARYEKWKPATKEGDAE